MSAKRAAPQTEVARVSAPGAAPDPPRRSAHTGARRAQPPAAQVPMARAAPSRRLHRCPRQYPTLAKPHPTAAHEQASAPVPEAMPHTGGVAL
eukprot:337342-Alexandrium_andersonii.AAC.1